MSNQSTPQHVLVTGAAGKIGRAVCRELTSRGHAVRSFDRHVLPAELKQDVEVVGGELDDVKAVRRAVSGMDCVIHLAAYPDVADFMTELLPANVIGLYHVLEAARAEQVQRLVLTSSVQVAWGLNWNERTISVEEPPAPPNHYAVTKVLAEVWGRMYAQEYGMSVIVVRPGACPRSQEQIDLIGKTFEDPSCIYLSPGDVGRFYAQCVESKGIDFAILFAMSKTTGHVAYDIEPARRLIGYEPQDQWPVGCDVDLP